MKSKRSLWVFWMYGMAGLLTGWAGAGPVEEAIELAANGLIGQQLKTGDFAGAWVGETDFTGTLVAGLVEAYRATGNPAALAAARLGGAYIVQWSENYYGDEAYALCLLGTATGESLWCERVRRFYEWIRTTEEGGTQGYLDKYELANPSIAVYYLAYHTMAAYRVDATDKRLYRAGVVRYLRQVQDSTSDYPVLALGVATWALAATGPMDSTLVRPGAGGAAVWNGVTLAGLPVLLASHQIRTGSQAGHFYWRFDHQGGSGYTEDLAYGLLGLAGGCPGSSGELLAGIQLARQMLPGAVYEVTSGAGAVYEQVGGGGLLRHYFAGETLQALAASVLTGDINEDSAITAADLSRLAAIWYEDDCAYPGWCNRGDLNHDGVVNLADFYLLTQSWGVAYP